jgi:hypothetical protein
MKNLRMAVLGISCALLSPLLAAAKPAIPDPYLARPCAAPEDAVTELSAPSGVFVNAGNKCPAVCHRAEKQCEQYVKLAVTCQKDNVQDEVAYAKLSCNVTLTGAEKKTCLEQAGMDGQQGRLELGTREANDLAQCQTWGGECVAGCP